MADFAAVLKKTIDGLADATPHMRERVYEKARATVSAKLKAINPPPAAAVIERQTKSLEDAISEIEAEYRAGEYDDDPLAGLDTMFSEMDEPVRAEAVPASEPGRSFEIKPADDYDPKPFAETPVEPSPQMGDRGQFDDAVAEGRTYVDDFEPAPRKRNFAGIIAALIILALLGGGAYAAWLNKEDLSAMFGIGAPVTATDTPADVAVPVPAPTAGATETAATPEKFTQRLNSDGTEIDEGPAAGAQTIGEGTSVASATQSSTEEGTPPAVDPEQPEPVAAPTESAEAAAAAPAAPATEVPALAVGQKAIFYEERTNQAQGSADTGSIVWSVVQESPGGDLPPEPAIRAEATIPGKELQLRMTIRRNGDTTLPASHIIEMIFLTPENFDGGGIENILRVSLKDSEQSAGNALLGIPAKIADGFFLVALTDTKAEVSANLTMLGRDQWIDVPLVYKNGRRALITMEKGIPGDKAFDEVIKSWQAKASAG
ncbi:hypothetical protein GA830_02670 [Mesorhizobium sp. NBSH29]|uniref:hypothetical protein n=1 Tax=Mesorhizobium sp. NBSH29 TaxID=2654249 RepID=UPI001896676D|nr:hypothetical protein [Mesorhizobium sp. NBSH29]QPC85753.1 hypothetical protein GA830_02670 [Mesorhizobium sp. NBSH29]